MIGTTGTFNVQNHTTFSVFFSVIDPGKDECHTEEFKFCFGFLFLVDALKGLCHGDFAVFCSKLLKHLTKNMKLMLKRWK